MRRQRKEIIKKMYELDEQRAVDRELGCGYTASDFGYPDLFDAAMDALREELAATYGMTAAEYVALEYEIADRLVANTAWDLTL